MKQFFLKVQFWAEAAILLATFGIVFVLLPPSHYRWDLTKDKTYSLPQNTSGILKNLKGQRIDVLLFYSQEDPLRQGLEVFLKECQRHHPEFHYDFYDPDQRPRIAKQFNVREPSTVVIRSGDREERVIQPGEEDFANAFLRILHPKDIQVCFVAGHDEAGIFGEDQNGFQKFRETLEGYNAKARQIVLERDHIPDACQVVVVGGPRFELKTTEWDDLGSAFDRGKGLFLLIDPMDPGVGTSFEDFAARFGILLARNVIVDKGSRAAGGDFLMPLVSQYYLEHPAMNKVKDPTFFPLVRAVEPLPDIPAGLELKALALTGSGSWAETDLAALENGNAVFDVTTDTAGPLPVAVAIEQTSDKSSVVSDKKKQLTTYDLPLTTGRMIIIGDSDFLTNNYLNIAGNKELGINIIRWLGRDDRFIDVTRPDRRFQPLSLGAGRRGKLLAVVLVFYPVVFFLAGGLYLLIRSRTS